MYLQVGMQCPSPNWSHISPKIGLYCTWYELSFGSSALIPRKPLSRPASQVKGHDDVAVVRLVFFTQKNTIRLQYKQDRVAEARYTIPFQLFDYKYNIYHDIKARVRYNDYIWLQK